MFRERHARFVHGCMSEGLTMTSSGSCRGASEYDELDCTSTSTVNADEPDGGTSASSTRFVPCRQRTGHAPPAPQRTTRHLFNPLTPLDVRNAGNASSIRYAIAPTLLRAAPCAITGREP